jgi:two-component system, chemotaxis family, protein-glutamate methylesterase/glutaminase
VPSSPRLVVIAASAGGLPAIVEVLAPLPADFPAAIAIVQHRGPDEPELMLDILSRRTKLRVQHAVSGAVLEPGTVYVCPPGVHMTTERSVHLVDGPRIEFVRPSADLMFDSVAHAYGARAIGVVLSGCGDDAALGSLAIAHAGGTVLAQDTRTCQFEGMPAAAVKIGAVEAEMTPAEIALELERLVHGRAGKRGSWSDTPIDVVLADDHRIVLDGLRVLLESEPDLRVVAHTEDGAAAIEAAIELEPDAVVMDIRMPGIDGIESTRQILAKHPHIHVIALSAENEPAYIDRMLQAGAAGYLTKHRAFDDLVTAIHTVMNGKPYLSPEVARLVKSGSVSPPRGRVARRR